MSDSDVDVCRKRHSSLYIEEWCVCLQNCFRNTCFWEFMRKWNIEKKCWLTLFSAYQLLLMEHKIVISLTLEMLFIQEFLFAILF
jgi:hypothetical protein